MLFNLDFANYTILLCFFLFLIPVIIMQFVNPIVELAIAIGNPNNKAKAEMKTQPVIGEITISE